MAKRKPRILYVFGRQEYLAGSCDRDRVLSALTRFYRRLDCVVDAYTQGCADFVFSLKRDYYHAILDKTARELNGFIGGLKARGVPYDVVDCSRGFPVVPSPRREKRGEENND
jgi:hypothetical protein